MTTTIPDPSTRDGAGSEPSQCDITAARLRLAHYDERMRYVYAAAWLAFALRKAVAGTMTPGDARRAFAVYGVACEADQLAAGTEHPGSASDGA